MPNLKGGDERDPKNAANAMFNATTAADLPEYWREHYEERAAIREYEGGQSREQAEAEALRETIDMMNADKERAVPPSSGGPGMLVTPAKPNASRTPGERCPECGGLLVPESGCWHCVHCGYSRCG
jgi:hypothetical protein